MNSNQKVNGMEPISQAATSTRQAVLRHRSWLAVPALVLLLGAAGTAIAQAQPMGPGAEGGPGIAHRMGPGMGHEMGGGHVLPERMLDAAGASADQKAKVHEIFKAARQDMARQHESQRALHQQMTKLLLAPQVDAAAAESLRQQLQAGHDVASKRMLKAMLDASAVLTPEQRQKLGDRMKARHDMMERHQRERHSMDAPKS
jgi:Spy/CpxP family protein refolding chaperone